jgi:hypothetical protein
VNKLSEYLAASATRRKAILKDQKYPPTFQAAVYTEAEQAIVAYLRVGRSPALLDGAVERLRAHQPSGDWDRQRVELCTEAIAAFRKVDHALDLDGLTLIEPAKDPPVLTFADVGVSVRPELVVLSADGARVGVIKLHLAKTANLWLDDDSGACVAALCHQFTALHLRAHGSVDHRLVRVVEVFGGRVFPAARATARRLSAIAAACEEIAARWTVL